MTLRDGTMVPARFVQVGGFSLGLLSLSPVGTA